MLDLVNIKFTPSPNWSSRKGSKITHIVIHAMIGTCSGTAATFDVGKPKDPAGTSAHYGIDRDGSLVRYVIDANKAWHVMNANPFCLGIELADRYFNAEGKLTLGSDFDPNWVTDPQLEKCANLTATLMQKYNIPLSNVIGHGDPLLKKYGNDHHDPGKYFPWDKFKTLINSNLTGEDK